MYMAKLGLVSHQPWHTNSPRQGLKNLDQKRPTDYAVAIAANIWI